MTPAAVAALAAAPAMPVAGQATSHREQLSNGLVLLHTETGPSPTVAVCMLVRAGAAAEPPGQAGLRQLLVRVLLDQRAARGARLRATLADLGARVSSDVTQDFVEVCVRAASEDLEAALVLQRSLLLEPEFAAAAVARQRAALLSEAREEAGTLAARADRAAAAALYPGRELGLPWVGPGDPLPEVSAADLAAFHHGHFTVNRLVLSIAGAVPRRLASEAVRRQYGALLPGGAGAPPPPALGAPTGPTTLNLPAEGDAALVEVVGRAPAVDDDAAPATAMALAVLGDGMGSRLYRTLREQRGLAYTARSFTVPAAWGARAGVVVTCDQAQARVVSNLVQSEVDRVQEVLATEEELGRAAQYLVTQYRLAHQGNQGLAHALGAFEVTAHRQGYGWDRELPLRLRAVRAGEAREAARQLFAAAVTVRVGVPE